MVSSATANPQPLAHRTVANPPLSFFQTTAYIKSQLLHEHLQCVSSKLMSATIQNIKNVRDGFSGEKFMYMCMKWRPIFCRMELMRCFFVVAFLSLCYFPFRRRNRKRARERERAKCLWCIHSLRCDIVDIGFSANKFMDPKSHSIWPSVLRSHIYTYMFR